MAKYKAKRTSSKITGPELARSVDDNTRLGSFLAPLPDHAIALRGPLIQLIKDASNDSCITVAENDKSLVVGLSFRHTTYRCWRLIHAGHLLEGCGL